MKSAWILAPLALLAACATSPEGADASRVAATGREEVITCGYEEPTGSKMRVKRCWTREERAQEGEDARKAMDRVQSVRPPPPPPGSGR